MAGLLKVPILLRAVACNNFEDYRIKNLTAAELQLPNHRFVLLGERSETTEFSAHQVTAGIGGEVKVIDT